MIGIYWGSRIGIVGNAAIMAIRTNLAGVDNDKGLCYYDIPLTDAGVQIFGGTAMAFVDYQKKGHVVTITLNRPERMNALGKEVTDEFLPVKKLTAIRKPESRLLPEPAKPFAPAMMFARCMK